MTAAVWVLVVEDEPVTRELLCRALRGWGYAAQPAADGAEALAVLRGTAGPPCLVLLDLHMPVLNGRQFLRERGRDQALATVPVVLMSGDGEDGSELGADGVLPKPFDHDELLRLVRRHCGPPHDGG